MIYAIREALQIVTQEGLLNRFNRHEETAKFFWAKLDEMGLEPLVEEKYRLWTLTTIKVPPGVDDKQVCKYLLDHFNIEIGAGLGKLAGKAWRVGFMGYNSRKDNVLVVCSALEEALIAHGCTREMRLRGKVAKL
jgi:alanine-glyoxylate transaminase/serine-glyoxylate transaminase/serine-pyruvate transaminase